MQIIIGILLGFVLLGIGFLIGLLTSRRISVIEREPLKLDNFPSIGGLERTTVPEKLEVEEMPLGPEDNINHDGVGIVQRPSAEELSKFAEPQAVKEGKEAVAEVIRNTPEPEI